MNILILNWKDIRNPKCGGAEILTHEYAKRLVKSGHKVVLVCPAFPDCKKKESIDGVNIIRLGIKTSYNYLFIHLFAFLYYLIYLKNRTDLVIDEIHGMPFFTPLYIKEKKIAFICEIAGDIWDKTYIKPIAVLGRIIEKFYLWIYRITPINFITISYSTKKELMQYGIDSKKITIVNPGIDLSRKNQTPFKNKQITLVWLNRISRMKNLKDAIFAFKLIRDKIDTSCFIVAGRVSDKNYYLDCQKYARSLGIEKQIEFRGEVMEDEKNEILLRSHILLHTSTKEGWGINVLEANLRKTPAVAYRVNGLTETIKDDITGILCDINLPDELAKEVIKLIKDQDKYHKMQKICRRWASNFSWEKSYREFKNILDI